LSPPGTGIDAQAAPVAVHVAEDVVPAVPADDLALPESSDPLGRLVPESDAPLPIGEIDALAEVVEQLR